MVKEQYAVRTGHVCLSTSIITLCKTPGSQVPAPPSILNPEKWWGRGGHDREGFPSSAQNIHHIGCDSDTHDNGADFESQTDWD